MKISGYTVIRNALKGDYCIVECINSLLPICDEVVIGHRESDDGTDELLECEYGKNPKVRTVTTPWNQPLGNIRWFVDWINETRQHLSHPFQLMLDADEVLDAGAYPRIKQAAENNEALWFERINFIRDSRTVIAHGETCGHLVTRCGPSHLWMPSDEPYGTHEEEPEIRKIARFEEPLPVIFHYGFLRRNEAMFEKTKVNLMGFFGSLDERLVRAEQEGKHWQEYAKHKQPYLTYSGPHPEHCHQWLKERGAM